MGTKTCRIISRVYLKGEIAFSRKSDYVHLVKLPDFSDKLSVLMESHHKTTIDLFVQERSGKRKFKQEYFDEVRQLLRRGNSKSALSTLEEALEKFPGDPFFLSYYGCLVAYVQNKPDEGVKICEDAIKELRNSVPFGSDSFYPVFYLNLGKAYLKADNKKEAISAFKRGLKIDRNNTDLLWEIQKLGIRKSPAISFLKRSNPINKHLGMLTGKAAGKVAGKAKG
jgi:tetratricopeptide (TPR) repeat protein